MMMMMKKKKKKVVVMMMMMMMMMMKSEPGQRRHCGRAQQQQQHPADPQTEYALHSAPHLHQSACPITLAPTDSIEVCTYHTAGPCARNLPL